MAISIGKKCFIASSATLIGDVMIGDSVAIMDNAVLRGDQNRIIIGDNSNIQDNVTVHTDDDYPTTIGRHVSVGHNAIVHGSIVEDYVIVGMGAITLNGSRIGSGSVIAAGSVVTQNFSVPEKSLVAGIPGAVKRSNDSSLLEYAKLNALAYSNLREGYLQGKYEIIRGSEIEKH